MKRRKDSVRTCSPSLFQLCLFCLFFDFILLLCFVRFYFSVFCILLLVFPVSLDRKTINHLENLDSPLFICRSSHPRTSLPLSIMQLTFLPCVSKLVMFSCKCSGFCFQILLTKMKNKIKFITRPAVQQMLEEQLQSEFD